MKKRKENDGASGNVSSRREENMLIELEGREKKGGREREQSDGEMELERERGQV